MLIYANFSSPIWVKCSLRNPAFTAVYNFTLRILSDIRESIVSIESYLGEKRDFNDYLNNKMLRRAIEREFEIIGEAMGRIDKIHPNIGISSKRQIISMRNRVIHGYDKIDDDIIWGTIVRHLPILKDEINKLLGD